MKEKSNISRLAVWAVLGLGIEGGCLALALYYNDPAASPVPAILIWIAISLFYLGSIYQGCRIPLSPMVLVVASLMFRLTLWTATPSFSNDAYRYRWEGRAQASGLNPYAIRPLDPDLEYLRDGTYARIPIPEAKAIYGPLWELVQRGMYPVAAAVSTDAFEQARWFRLPAALADLGVTAALLWLLRLHGLPLARIVVYAWCPLPIIEFWGNGHNDALLLLFLALAFCFAKKEWWVWGFVALALAAMVKWWPLGLFPLFVLCGGRARRWQWVAAIPVILLCAAPYWSGVSENARFASGFLGGWRNNDSVFGLILALTGDPMRARQTATALIAAGTLWLALRRGPLERSAQFWIAGLLLVSANVHPWYLTWLLPLLTLDVWLPLLAWISLAPVFYTALIDYRALGVWNGVNGWRWLVYGPVAALALFRLRRERRRMA